MIFFERPLLGVLFLLAVLLPWQLLRASHEGSLWVDETYSLMMTRKSVGALIEHTSADAHPPGYYLMLKAWLKLPRLVGHEPGIFYARFSSVLGWVALVLVSWFGSRRLLGVERGTLVAWAVGCTGLVWALSKDLRNYAWVLPMLWACFLIQSIAHREERAGTLSRRAAIGLWFGYFALAAASLYFHLLSAFLLFLLGLLWIARCTGHRWRSGFVLGGAAAQAATVLAFLPWLLRLRDQVQYLAVTPTEWMTPPTLLNLASVFAYCAPWGNPVAFPEAFNTNPGLRALLWGLGTTALLLPICGFLAALLARPGTRRDRDLGHLGALAFVGFGFGTLLWAISALDIAKVFHSARYPVLGLPMAAGALALAASITARGRRWVAWSLMGPWLLIGAAMLVVTNGQERGGGPQLAIAQLDPAMRPAPGEPLYVMPSELIPMFRETLAPWDVRRIEDLTEVPAEGVERVFVAELSLWESIRSNRDSVASGLVRGGQLAESTVTADIPPGIWAWMRFHRLDRPDRDRWPEIVLGGLAPASPPVPGHSLAVATPGGQNFWQGWSVLEAGADAQTWRWAIGGESLLRFDRALPPGDYIVHVRGHRNPYPEETVEMTFSTPAMDEPVRAERPAGAFETPVLLRWGGGGAPFEVRVTCPTYRPSEFEPENKDGRPLGWLLLWAWVEAVPETVE
ncbi:MAG: hypothetical protein RLY93_18040 [Sumerlaeia bacterium]